MRTLVYMKMLLEFAVLDLEDLPHETNAQRQGILHVKLPFRLSMIDDYNKYVRTIAKGAPSLDPNRDAEYRGIL